MIVKIKVSGKKEVVPSTLKVGRFYDAQVYKVFPIQPTRFNLDGNREYGIIYSCYDPLDKIYAAQAETFQVVTGPTSTLLNLLIAVTHKHYTSKMLEGKSIDLDLMVGKHLSLSFKLTDKGFLRVDARMPRKAEKCIKHDLTIAEEYVLPNWIRPEVVEGADVAELEEVDEGVDLNDVLSKTELNAIKADKVVKNGQVKGEPVEEDGLSGIVGFDCTSITAEDPEPEVPLTESKNYKAIEDDISFDAGMVDAGTKKTPIKTIDIPKFLKDNDLLGEYEDVELYVKQKFFVPCPWEESHTTKSGAKDTLIVYKTNTLPVFHCPYCATLGIYDYVNHYGDRIKPYITYDDNYSPRSLRSINEIPVEAPSQDIGIDLSDFTFDK